MIIIARNKENINWAKDHGHEIAVIEKDVHLPNEGREASSYLYFILTNYESLPEEMIFCQGNPFDHCGFFLEEIKTEKNYYGATYECLPDGSPHHKGLEIDNFLKELGIRKRKLYKFKAGAQFRVEKKDVLKYSFDWYTKAYNISMTNKQAPWIFERIWPLIFNNLKLK